MSPSLLRATYVGALLTLTPACSIVPDNDPPGEGRVVVQASPQIPLELIVSTDFTTVTQADGTVSVMFESSDTVSITGDFDRRYALSRADARIVAILANRNESEEPVRLRVLLDGDTKYDVSATLGNGGSLKYTYQYQEGTFADG
ncbi:MAG: hypothetical protein P8170_16390 [Gemmatimonadota bacterium]|jgi:hypothetical protein